MPFKKIMEIYDLICKDYNCSVRAQYEKESGEIRMNKIKLILFWEQT